MGKNGFSLRFIALFKRMIGLFSHSKTAIAPLLFFLLMPAAPAFPNIIEEVPAVGQDEVAVADPLFHDIVSRGISLVFNDQYEESLPIFERLLQMYPVHPAPHFFMAAVYQNWMSALRTNRFQKQVEEHVQHAIQKGIRLLKRKNDPWLHFYVGSAYGFRAFNLFRKHDWISSYFAAKTGINHFEKALQSDPNLYDVYLGLGSYHYWRTAKSKFLRLIAFWIADRRELGLRQLEFSAQHGLYAKDLASYNLIAAYFDYGQYQKAMDVLERTTGRKSSPTSTDLYYKGRLLIKFGRWPEAESAFKEILQDLENHNLSSVGYKVECRYWIAVALKAQNKADEALLFTEEALAQSKNRNGASELEGPFEDFGEIKDRLARLRLALKKEPVEFFADDSEPEL